MKKWILLVLITMALLLLPEVTLVGSNLHPAYLIMVCFFAIQTFVLLRIDVLIPKQWSVQGSLVKIILRFLSSATLILVLIYQYDEPFSLVVQFIVLYLIYMIFEIVVALTNLRRN